MERMNGRYIGLFAVILVVFLFLGGAYLSLILSAETTIDEDGNEVVSTLSTREIEIEGKRGSILDSNGIPLAYDTASYNVQFTWASNSKKSSDKANYTRIFQKTIAIIEENGGEVIDTFMIKKDEETGEFYFDVRDLSEKAQQSRIEKWCTNMQISDPEMTPEEMYYELRASYRIPEDTEYDEALKLLSIWQEAQLGSYKSYLPVTIAENVSYNTVLTIETRANELTGMSIEESGSRVYPKSTLAAHAIGYTGKITAEDDVDAYEEAGYDIDNDTVGKSGIESTMEEYLTASTSDKKGAKTISVDSAGGLVEELEYTGAKDGDDVILTIDVKMQEALEAALKKNIEDVHAYQVETYNNPDKKAAYDEAVKERKDPEVKMCVSGAAIVIDPRTAEIKAIASYPSFDLNLFVGGISDADYKALSEDEATPLFNNAVSAALTPGSIFKMCTGIAGLMEGKITTTEVINDIGPYTKHVISGKAPKCWVAPAYSKHADNQNIVKALRVSCNYFFYEVADRLGIEKLQKWVDKFGLSSKTGVELTGEVSGNIGSQKTLYDNTKSINNQSSYTPILVYNKIYSILKEYGEDRKVEYTEEMLTEATTRIVALAGSVEGEMKYGDEIRQVLSEVLDIPVRVSKTDYLPDGITRVQLINQYLSQLVWTDANTVTQGIGVEPTQLTPIAVAKYVCALANGGKVLQPHIVDRIVDADGNIVYQTETTVVEDLEIPQSYMNAIYEGMKEVVAENQGGNFDLFKNFTYTDILAAKTGTGKVSDIDLENNGWFVCFAPLDANNDPEIAVIVALPHGAAGIRAGQTAVDFLQYYFDSKNAVSETVEPAEGSLVE